MHTYMYTYSFCSHVIYVKGGEVENEHIIIIIHIGTKGDLCIYVLKNVTSFMIGIFFYFFFTYFSYVQIVVKFETKVFLTSCFLILQNVFNS